MRSRLLHIFTSLLAGLLITGCADTIGVLTDFLGNRPPRIIDFQSDSPGADELLPDERLNITLTTEEPDGDPIEIEFFSSIGLFTNQETSGDTTQVIFTLPKYFTPTEELYVEAVVTDHLGRKATQRLYIGSGKKGAVVTNIDVPVTTMRSNEMRTMSWTADQDGFWQFRIRGAGQNCTADDSQPFTRYTAGTEIPASVYGNQYPQAPGNILQQGSYRICFIVRDTLDQEGVSGYDFLVDGYAPATNITPAGGLYNTPQTIALGCNDLDPGLDVDDREAASSQCLSTIYTFSINGPAPADPVFNANGSPATGILAEETAIMDVADGQVVTIKYRSMDNAGNIGDIQTQAITVNISDTEVVLVNRNPVTVSVGGAGAHPAASDITWNAEDGGIAVTDTNLTYKTVLGPNCNTGVTIEEASFNGSGSDITTNVAASLLSGGTNNITLCAEVLENSSIYAANTTTLERVEEFGFTIAADSVDEDGGFIRLDFDLTAALDQDVTLEYAITGGTAVESQDFNIGDGTIDIPAGFTTGDIPIAIEEDVLTEGSETIIVELTGTTGAGTQIDGTRDTFTVTITDNEGTQVVNLSGDDSAFDENGGTGVITATLSAISGTPVTVPINFSVTPAGNFSVPGGSAVIIIPPYQISETLVLTAIDNAIDGTDITFSASLGTIIGAGPGASTSVNLTITDDDYTPPTVEFTTDTVDWPEDGGNVLVTISQSMSVDRDVTVPIVFSGSAGASDYTESTQSVVITAGNTSSSFTVAVNDDGVQEPTETIIMTLGTLVNADPGVQTTQTIYIDDNDRVGPKITDVDYCDTDANAQLDHARITFDKNIVDSTLDGSPAAGALASISPGNWKIAGYTNVRFDRRASIISGSSNPCGADGTGDMANDNILWLAFDEITTPDTSAKPDLTVADSSLQSNQGCYLFTDNPSCESQAAGDVVTSDVAENDLARPMITTIVASAGSDAVTISFSEAVDTHSGAACGASRDLEISDFIYNDANGSGATGLSGEAGDASACNDTDYTVVMVSNNPFIESDLSGDSIGAAANEIYDTSALAAYNNNVAPVILNPDPVGLVLHMPMDTNEGDSPQTVHDISDNAYTGVVEGAFLTADLNGDVNSAYAFGGDDKISIEYNPTWRVTATIAFWVKASDGGNLIPLVGNDSGGGGHVSTLIHLNKLDFCPDAPGKLILGLEDGGSTACVTSTQSVADNDWHHIAVVVNGSTYQIYIDGFLDTQSTESVSGIFDNNASEGLVLGWDSRSNYYMTGKMDDFRVYTSALSGEAIREFGIKVPDGLTYWYPFNGDANDYSGNGNHGTPVGTAYTAGRYGVADHSISFDANRHVELPEPIFANIDKTNSTITGWMYFNNAATNHVIYADYSTTGSNYRYETILLPSASYVHYSGTAFPVNVGTTNYTGRWVHFAAVTENDIVIVYYDGVAVGSANIAHTPALTNPEFGGIGSYFTGSIWSGAHMSGRIDDLRFYNRPLSEAEILTLRGESNSDMLAYWPLGETTADASGNGFTLTETGSVAAGANRAGTAQHASDFNNSLANYYERTGFTSTDGITEMTVALWFRSYGDNGNQQYIFTVPNGYTIHLKADGALVFSADSSIGWREARDEGDYRDDNWHFVAGVFDNGQMDLWVDGRWAGTQAAGDAVVHDGTTVRIGQNIGNRPLNGLAEDVRIYGRALSEAELIALGGAPSEGLMAWYPLDGDLTDYSLYSKNGYFNTGTPSFIADWLGNASSAADFDSLTGGGDGGTIPTPNYTMSDKVSLSTWVKLNDMTDDYALAYRYDDSFRLQRDGNGDELTFVVETDSLYQARTGFPFYDGAWHHVAASYDGSRIRTYVDGVLGNTTVASGLIKQSFGDARVGWHLSPAERWNGGLDDIRIYDRVLTLAEVREMGGFNPRHLDGMVSWFRGKSGVFTDLATRTLAANNDLVDGWFDSSNTFSSAGNLDTPVGAPYYDRTTGAIEFANERLESTVHNPSLHIEGDLTIVITFRSDLNAQMGLIAYGDYDLSGSAPGSNFPWALYLDGGLELRSWHQYANGSEVHHTLGNYQSTGVVTTAIVRRTGGVTLYDGFIGTSPFNYVPADTQPPTGGGAGHFIMGGIVILAGADLTGGIYETMIFDRRLTDFEIEQLACYLDDEYGGTHPYTCP